MRGAAPLLIFVLPGLLACPSPGKQTPESGETGAVDASVDAQLDDRAGTGPADAGPDAHLDDRALAPDASGVDLSQPRPDGPPAHLIAFGLAYEGRASDGEDLWVDLQINDAVALGQDWSLMASTFSYVTPQLGGAELPWNLADGDVLRAHGPGYTGGTDLVYGDNNPDRWDVRCEVTFPINMKHGAIWLQAGDGRVLDLVSYETSRNELDWLSGEALTALEAAVVSGQWTSADAEQALFIDAPDDSYARLIDARIDGQSAADWLLLGGAQVDYYIEAEGLTGVELKAALNRTIKGHTVVPYDELTEALALTDPAPTEPGLVVQFYSGGTTVADYNREHVWAKSHGGFDTDGHDGYSDLHHIRPTRTDVNTARWHLDFDEGGELYSDTPCRIVEGLSWEPRDAVKGDVARTLFYMAVRYEGDDSNMPDLELVEEIPSLLNASGEPDNYSSMNTPRMGRLSTLKRWHTQDPPDDVERARNQIIYEQLQHNRNPFVDHPEWVQEIWGP